MPHETIVMKKNRNKLSSLLLGAAVAGLMAGTTTLTSCSGGDSNAQQKNGCNGPNGCGGAADKNAGGAEKKDANGCNGANGCKGQDATQKKN